MKPVEIEILMKGNLGRGLDDARRKAESLDSVLKRVGATVGIAFGTREAVEFARKIMDVRGEVESLQISFETLAGKTKGQKLFGDIRDFAVSTPMMMQDLAKGAQTLLGFNVEAEKVMPILRQIGDISMGDAQKFNSLTLAFSQMSSTGKLMGQDLLQMINAGFNPLVVISEKTGKSMAALKKEMSEGRITVKMVEDAFAAATAEGGRFHGMLEKQSKGIKGAMSNLQGAWEDMLNDIGEKSQGKMVDVISLTQQMVKNYEKVLDVLAQIVVAYGSYKAALMMVVAAQKAMAIAENIRLVMMFRKEMGLLTAAQQAFNRAALVNPYVLIGVAAAGAGVAIYNLAKADNAAEAAQKKLNKTLEDADRLAKDHQRELEELTRTATDEAASTDDRRTAMQQLLDKYPSIIQKYIDEKGHLTDIINLKREIARLDGQEKAGKLDTEYQKASRYLELYKKANTYGGGMTPDERKEYRQLTSEIWDEQSIWTKFRNPGSRGKFVADYYREQLPGLQRSSARTKTENMLREYNYGLEKMTDAELEKMSQDAQNALKKIGDRNSAYLDSYTNDFLTRGDLAERLGVIGSILDKRHPANTTTTTTKTDKKDTLKEQREQEAKAIEEERRWQEKISGIKRDAADAQRDAEIAAIRDDGERERAEEEEQHRRRLRQIADEADEIRKAIYEHNKEVWENAHKDSPYELTEAGKAGWSAIQLPQDQLSIIDAREKKENEEHNRRLRERLKSDEEAQKAAIYQYISIFGDYEMQKTAIEKKADDEIFKLEEKLQYAKTDLEKASINAQIELVRDGAKKETEELDKKFGKTAHALGDLFADASKKSISQIDNLIKKYKAFMQFYSNEGVTKDDLVNKFGFTDKEIEEITNKLKTGEISLKEYQDGVEKLQHILSNKSPWKSFTTKIEELNEKINKSIENEDFDTESFGESLQTVGDMIDQTIPQLERFGEAMGTIFHFDKSEYDNAIKGIQNFGNLAKGIGQIYSGDYISGVTNAASGIAGFYSMLTMEEEKARARQHHINILNDHLSALNDSVIRLTDKMDDVYGAEVLAMEEEARQKAQKQQETSISELRDSVFKNDFVNLPGFGKNRLAYQIRELYDMGHDTEGRYYDRVNDFRNAGFSEEMIKLFLGGDDWEAMFANMTDEEIAAMLKDIKENHEDLWAEIINLNDGYGEEFFNSIIDAYDQLEEIELRAKEAITQTSFDEVFNNFMSSLEDFANGSEDVFDDIADNWQKMVNKMVLYNIIGNEYKEKLKKWYEMWVEAYSGDEKISENEIEELRDEYNKIFQDAQNEIEQLRDMGIISATGENAGQSQTAKAGGFAAMSQDQGTKLDGMFTAGLQHWSSMDNELATVGDNIGKALDRLKRIEENTEYCRKLEEIAENIRAIKNNGVKVK